MSVKAENITYCMGPSSILQGVSLQIPSKKFVGLIGPNGSGKSTLLKMIYRVLQPDAGTVYLDDQNVHQMPVRSVFQRMAVVSQEADHNFDFSVQEIVMMGRTPHKGLFHSDTAEDLAIVEQSLSRVDMTEYRERSFLSLSGGEKQRVLIARALAQQAEIIVLDEPTNHLDIRHQLQLMDLVKTLDVTVLAALHDLNLASVYCDDLYVVQDGKVVAFGTPEEVITPGLLRDIFGVEAEILIHPVTQKPHITYLPKGSLSARC